MTVYALGDSVTLTYTAPADMDAVLHLLKPDGTESSPSVTEVTPDHWSSTFTADQYDTWLYSWTAGSDVEQGSFQVGQQWYATMAKARKAVNLKSTDTTKDDLLVGNLLGASRAVDNYTERSPGGFLLDSVATARVFSLVAGVVCTDEGTKKRVDDFGSLDDLLIEVTSDGVNYVEVTGYQTYPDNALARNEAIEAIITTSIDLRAYRRMRVTAKWGWPAIPAAVDQATLLQTSRLFRRKDSPEGVAGSTDWGLIRVPNLDPDVKALLAYLTSPFKAL